MEIPFLNRLRSMFNAFRSRDPTGTDRPSKGQASSTRPDRPRLRYGNEKSIVSAVYNRIALDVSRIPIKHVRLDENEQYKETLDTGLNNCLTLEANIDQSYAAFLQDIVISMFDEGVVAVVPIDTTTNPNSTSSFDILTMRVCRIVEWYPQQVRVEAYNDNTGNKEELVFMKTAVAIIENPFYVTMNLPNSVLKRLINKLNILDVIDEQSGSGKLNIIVKLPYLIRTLARQMQAEKRRKDIEDQLADNKYGIAYIDATENITQLNRPTDNNLMGQIEYLTHMLYSQLGITESVLDGTADEKTMNNYYSRSVDPVTQAICDAFKRSFLTKTARSQGQSIKSFRNPFQFVTAKDISDLADNLTRNAIVSSNELRSVLGMKPSNDPAANELRNKNLNPPNPNDKSVPQPSN